MELCSMFIVVLLTFSTLAVKPSSTSAIKNWMKKGWDDPNSVPQVKHVQMFNAGANAYIRIINRTVDATTTNNSDPDTYIQVDMYGPTLLAIRSYKTGYYVCHNVQTSNIEIKVKRDPGCLFYAKVDKKHYRTYTSRHNKHWHLAFHGKGRKKGQPRKGVKTVHKAKVSKYVEWPLSNLTKRRTG